MPIHGFRTPRPLAVLALALATFLFAGCGVVDSLYPPQAVTDQGREVRNLYGIVFAIAVAIFLLVEGLIVYAVLRYRRKPTDTELPPQVHGNNAIEIVWTVIPTLIVAFLFFVSWQTLNSVDARTATPDVRIRAVAARFQWTFEYLSPDGADVLFTQLAPEMTVPAGETVQLSLRSTDVIHAFYVPQFLFKRDVVPGKENVFDFRVDADDAGQTFNGQCAELCGTFHGAMRFAVKALAPADYDAWLQEQIDAAAATPPPPPPGSPPPGQATVEIHARDIAFSTAALEAKAGAPFTIHFANDDAGVPHNVEIKDASGAAVFVGEIFPGADSRDYPIPALDAGSYPFMCTVHPNMTGTLTVK